MVRAIGRPPADAEIGRNVPDALCAFGKSCLSLRIALQGHEGVTEDDGYPRRGDLDRKWDDQLKEPA
jgi:hypothetical protein